MLSLALMTVIPAMPACRAANIIGPALSQTKVKTGIEVLREDGFKILQGKKVGLITNQTGVDSKLRTTIDILYNAPGLELVALFGPEHGVRGDSPAGEYVESYTDEKTGLPVYSLYGKTRKPTEKMLEGIDVLVYDIQDIGVRSYTYISTMGYTMEAAAQHGIEYVVLDRPNPLGGYKIEGSPVKEGFFSMVSAYPIPYVYGLTCGELAKLYVEEKLLNSQKRCNLSVVAMKGWHRNMNYKDTGLPWVLSSPHLPNPETAAAYVATGVMGELFVFSEGVGYTLPFQLYAAEWIDQFKLAEAMNDLGMEGVMFRPLQFKPYYGRDKAKELHGVQIYISDAAKVNLMSLQFRFMEVHHNLYPGIDVLELSKKRHNMFDKVTGSSEIRETFFKNYLYDDIKELLNEGVDEFRQISKQYYLYK